MKLRVRLYKKTSIISLPGECKDVTLASLKSAVADEFVLHVCDFELSLNGKDSLEGEEKSLHEMDIVSGDLIKVLVTKPAGASNQSNTETTNQRKSCNNQGNTSHCSQDVHKMDTKDGNNSRTSSNYSDSRVLESQSVRSNENSTVEQMDTKESSSFAGSRLNTHSQIDQTKSTESSPVTDNKELISQQLKEVGLIGLEDGAGLQDVEVNRYLREPMLLRESTNSQIPQTLRQIYTAADVQNANEALCVAVHALMLETGFQTKITEVASSSALAVLPSQDTVFHLPNSWRQQGVYRLTYILPGCDSVNCTIALVPLGSCMLIHGLPDKMTGAKCQMKIKPSDYVRKANTDPEGAFQNLDRLSRLFKDTIAQPLLLSIRQEAGFPSSTGFAGVLVELKRLILQKLDAVSLSRVSRTCKDMHIISQDAVIWKRLYLRDFGKRANMSLDQDWNKMYKEMYLLRKKMRQQFRHMTYVVPPLLQRPHPINPFVPYAPGMIGGEQDLDPFFQVLDISKQVVVPVFDLSIDLLLCDTWVKPHKYWRRDIRMSGPPGAGQLLRPRYDPIGPLYGQGSRRDRGRPRGGFGFGPKLFF